MYIKHYVNLTTSEVSDSKSVARTWYKDGYSVEVYHDGRRFVTLNNLGI